MVKTVIRFGAVFLLMLGAAAVWAFGRGSSTVQGLPQDVARNERLTALGGALIYVLLVAVAVTVLDIRGLLAEHYAVGLLLIPPLLLKLGSTGYRFAAYYAGSQAFRTAGAPPIVLRFVV